MVKKILSTLINVSLFSIITNAQKPVIDTGAISHWPHVTGARLSEDGDFIYYTYADESRKEIRTIESLDGSWKREVSNGQFNFGGSKFFIYQSGDSLFRQSLGKNDSRFVARISSFELLKGHTKQWLSYRTADDPTDLVIIDLASKRQMEQNKVLDFRFNASNDNIILRKRQDESSVTQLLYCDLLTGEFKSIWSGNSGGDFPAIDQQGKQIAFYGEEKNGGQKEYAIWYYRYGMEQAKKILGNAPLASDAEKMLNPAKGLSFNKSGNRLFYFVTEKNQHEQDSDINSQVKVDIWNYRSEVLHESPRSAEVINMFGPQRNAGFICVLDLSTIQSRLIDSAKDEFDWINRGLSERNDYLVFRKGHYTRPWLDKEKPSDILVSLKDGSSYLLARGLGAGYISKSENYLISYFRDSKTGFFVYDIFNKVERPLKGFSEKLDDFIGWTTDENSAFFSDRSGDIWLCDLSGRKEPINITHRFGQLKKIRFSIIGKENEHIKIIDPAQKQYLIAFDTKTKRNGFYALDIAKSSEPEMLSMDDCKYSVVEQFIAETDGRMSNSRKSEKKNTWLLVKESATLSPNYFVTQDFKNFKKISDVQPQMKYNWLTSELVKWKTENGQESMGVLYKPENFDSSKSYPVIFYYYEGLSDELNLYSEPSLTTARMNTPWFVSRGYLVFLPDIEYTIGHPGRSALNAVESAARFLMRFSWVDGKRMGIQGHSFGGYETNYIITHSDLFKAAAEGSGVTDLVSKYGDISSDGGWPNEAGAEVHYYEDGQGRMGAGSLWDNKQNYIDESPIFNAVNVTTPLLMMHNKQDFAVRWTQGVELFTALWRLQRPAWMLQYDNGGHGLNGSSPEALDYTIRMTQFFDHYLKDMPAPKWMTIPGYMGYDLNVKQTNR